MTRIKEIIWGIIYFLIAIFSLVAVVLLIENGKLIEFSFGYFLMTAFFFINLIGAIAMFKK